MEENGSENNFQSAFNCARYADSNMAVTITGALPGYLAHVDVKFGRPCQETEKPESYGT